MIYLYIYINLLKIPWFSLTCLHQGLQRPGSLQHSAAQHLQRRRCGGGGVAVGRRGRGAQRQGAATQGLAAQQQQLVGPRVHQVVASKWWFNMV